MSTNLYAALTALHTMLERDVGHLNTLELLNAARQADEIAARCRQELDARRAAAVAAPTGSERLYRQRTPEGR